MNALMTRLDSEFCRNLVAALAHTLWQGPLVATWLYMCLRRTPARMADRRYWAGLMSLVAIVLAALLTWSILNYEPEVPPAAGTPAAPSIASVHTQPSSIDTDESAPPIRNDRRQPHKVQSRTTWRMWAAGIWLVGALLMLLRAMAVVVGAGRLRRRCTPLEDETTLALVEQLRGQMRIARRIRVVVGEHVPVPGVIGCVWPTLLLPVAMASGMPADDLRAILAHELAHIRRFDYLVNFLQMVIEALLFFNPAIWWISRQIRIEREACCDAAGIALTGRRTEYAETLVAWAQRQRRQHAAPAAALMGLADGADEGKLVDRVRRIMIAGHRPRLRVSWPTALAMTGLSILALAGLWQGAGLAVAFAGKILTPQERIEKITEIAQEYGLPDREYGEEDDVKISGIVRTWDGKPLPKYPKVTVQSDRPRYGSTAMIDVSVKDQPQGVGIFAARAEYGRIYIIADGEGYAPGFAGPFDPKPGGTIEGIELVLGEGFSARIRVFDEAGQPIEGAELTGGYVYSGDGSYRHTIKLTTDQQGIATEQHAIEHLIGLYVEADGFEPERLREVMFKPNEVGTVTLRAVEPARGILVSAATGEPIAGAEVRLMFSRINGRSYGENGMHGKPDTVTDAEGRFALTRLSSAGEYLVFVRAEGYGYRYLSGVRPGEKGIEIHLGPQQAIRGAITGDLGRLSRNKEGQPVIEYVNNYRLGDHGQTSSHTNCPVTIENGVGHFEIRDFYGQRVIIYAGGQRLTVEVEEYDWDNVVIDLTPVEKVIREVVLVFKTPPDAPPLQGGVRIDHIQEGQRGYKPGWLEVVDGRAQCEVPVPCRFKYNIDYYHGVRPVGYWFAEAEPMEIAKGEGPLTIEVPVHPAGAIYGRILQPDGSVATDATASLVVAKRPDIVGKGLHDLNSALHGGGTDRGRFNATPLPLGGHYGIIARQGNYFHATKPLLLDEAHQIVEHDIQLAEGVPLTGRLIDLDGTAARDLVKLNISVRLGDEGNWSTETTEIRPDERGRFIFANVNPRFGGRHRLNVTVRPGYRPVKHKVEDVTRPVVIRLEKGKRLTGVVIDDATGLPVPDAEVYAYWHAGRGDTYEFESLEAEGATNQRGEFVFSNMAPREYKLGVREANLADPRHPVTALGGQKDPVILRIAIPEWSDLKPQDPEEN